MSSRLMSKQEEAWLAQKFANDPTIAAHLNNQVNNGQDFMQQAAKLYVCERCESGALAHGTGYACVHCGYTSTTRNTKVRDYLQKGMWR